MRLVIILVRSICQSWLMKFLHNYLELWPQFLKDILILEVLKKTKNSFTMGPDGIPSFILKDCANIFQTLLKPLTLISKSFEIPNIWKKSFSCSIFKSRDITDVSNYRSISLLCNVADHLYNQLSLGVLYNNINTALFRKSLR